MLVLPPPLDSDRAALLLAAASVVTSVLWFVSASRENRNPSGVKLREVHRLPSALPIIGNALDFYKHRHDLRAWSVANCLALKGEPWLRKIPGQPEMITIAKPDLIEEITTTQFENFEKGEFQREIVATLFGQGLVASDGERWAHQRKAGIRFFSARSLRALMNKSMHKNLEQVCGVLDEGEASGQPVDLKKLFLEFTLQTFVEMGMGVNLDWIGSKNPHPFQQAIDRASALLISRFKLPAWAWKLQRWLNVGVEGELANNMAIVYDWLHEVIEKSLAAQNKHDKETSDGNDTKSVVALFTDHSNEDKDGLHADDLADFLLTFVIGARDTTAMTLAWLFFALSRHPEVEATIRAELQKKLPNVVGRKDILITPDQIKELTYLEATIRETLRLYPAAPSTIKHVKRDTIIGGNIPLRKGQICVLHAYAMARNVAVWGDDAAEFKPERWIDTEINGHIRHFPASKFFSFHAGPRSCIGMSLALLELRSVTANLINRYRFAIDPSNDGSTTPGPTLIMKFPLNAAVTSVVQ